MLVPQQRAESIKRRTFSLARILYQDQDPGERALYPIQEWRGWVFESLTGVKTEYAGVYVRRHIDARAG